MRFPWKIVKVTNTPADRKLEEIRDILFPKAEVRTGVKDGKEFKYQINYDVDMNLDAVLTDLEVGHNDGVSQGTLRKIVARLSSVRLLLEAHAQIDKDAEYIIVDDPASELEIEAAEEDTLF